MSNLPLFFFKNIVSAGYGPNENMIGKNKSNPQSLIKALEFLDNK